MTNPSGHHVFNLIATDDRMVALLFFHEMITDTSILLDKFRIIPIHHHLVRIHANSTHAEEEIRTENAQFHIYHSFLPLSPTRIPNLLHVLGIVISSLRDRLIVSRQKWRLFQHHVDIGIAIDAIHRSIVHEGKPDELLGNNATPKIPSESSSSAAVDNDRISNTCQRTPDRSDSYHIVYVKQGENKD